MSLHEINTVRAATTTSPLSQAVRVGNLLFISGQTPRRPDTWEIIHGEFQEEVRAVLDAVRGIVEAAGGSLKDICKVNAYLTDISLFEEFNAVYLEYFVARPLPARTTIGCTLAREGIRVEVEAVAWLE